MKNFFIFLLILSTLKLNAQFTEQANIYPTNITPGDEFGSSADINENWMVVGAYYYNDVSSSPGYGSVYLWHNDGTNWNYNSQIIPSNNPYNGDQFGNAVAVWGNNMIVGSWNASSDGDYNPGFIYFYHYDGTIWTDESKFSCGINDYDLGFGSSVDIYGDYAIAGAPGIGSNTGAVFIYYRNAGSWELNQTFPADGSTDDYKGSSVAIGQDIAFIGASGANEVYVYTFDGSTWSLSTTLSVPGTVSFGSSMNYDGTSLIIGDEGANAAYIYIFDGTNWNYQKIVSSDMSSTDHFGCSVSVSGNKAVVGAWAKNSMTGAAYIFENNGGTWAQSQKITASNGNGNDRFGKSVAIENSYAVVGAFYDNPNNMGSESGSAYIFQSPPPPVPTITYQPQNIAVCEGNTAVFNITATDATSYQWYNSADALIDGGDISGVTTDQLSIANATQSDEDNYYCIVSNSAGDTQSNNAVLTVDTPVYASAGSDDYTCDGTYTLNADNPSSGIGEWGIISGCGNFNNINVNNTQITNLCDNNNTLRWTVTNGGCITYDDVIINYEHIYAGFSVSPETQTWPNATVNIENQSMIDADSYVWDFGDGNTQTDYSFVGQFDYTYNDFGIYTINLQVNGTNCNNSLSHSVTINEFGIVSNINNNNFSIKPNPTDGFFFIDNINFNKIIFVQIYDITGKKVVQKTKDFKHNFNISQFKSGIYFMTVKTSEGIYQTKFIKN